MLPDRPGRRARPPSLSLGTGGPLAGAVLAGAGSEPWPGPGLWGEGQVRPPCQPGLASDVPGLQGQSWAGFFPRFASGPRRGGDP